MKLPENLLSLFVSLDWIEDVDAGTTCLQLTTERLMRAVIPRDPGGVILKVKMMVIGVVTPFPPPGVSVR